MNTTLTLSWATIKSWVLHLASLAGIVLGAAGTGGTPSLVRTGLVIGGSVVLGAAHLASRAGRFLEASAKVLEAAGKELDPPRAAVPAPAAAHPVIAAAAPATIVGAQ